MTTRTVETLTWVLIFGGLLTACLGLALLANLPGAGTALATGGGIAAAVGFALIVVRSRMKGD